MGLELYVRWEGMTEKEMQVRHTTYDNIGGHGYLYKSWATLEIWDKVFDSVFNKDWCEFIMPRQSKVEDSNGLVIVVTDASRKTLEENKMILQEYIKNPKPIDESIKTYFGKEHSIEVVVEECKNMIDFLDFAMTKLNSRIVDINENG
jgi:hypothetical protein